MNITDIKRATYALRDQKVMLETRMSENERHSKEIERLLERVPNHLDLLVGTRNLLQTVSEETRRRITKGLEDVVTMCIHSVFGTDYSFRIVPKTKSNSTVIEFYIVDNSGLDEVVLPPESNFGGGMIDTISIGLRFGLMKVIPNPPSTPMILDEPAKMVSADRIESIANLVKELTRIFDKQVIMVTHQEVLMDLADRSLWFTKESGQTKITEG